MPSRPLSSAAACVPQSEDAMAPSNHLPKLRIALLFGAALMPALSLAQREPSQVVHDVPGQRNFLRELQSIRS